MTNEKELVEEESIDNTSEILEYIEKVEDLLDKIKELIKEYET